MPDSVLCVLQGKCATVVRAVCAAAVDSVLCVHHHILPFLDIVQTHTRTHTHIVCLFRQFRGIYRLADVNSKCTARALSPLHIDLYIYIYMCNKVKHVRKVPQ